MSRSILTAWRPVALAALLALAAAPTDVRAAGHGGGGFHGGGNDGGGGYHPGYNPGYFSGYHSGYSGYHNGNEYEHRDYGYHGGYYSPLLYGSPAYLSGGYDATPYYNYSSTYYAPDYVAPAVPPTGQYTSDVPAPAPDSTPGPATVDVHIPASAQVWFDGSPTTQTGDQRQYVSPSLTPGQDYTYDIRARWTDNGKVVDETRRVTVHADGVTSVDFTQPAPTVSASK